MYVDKPNYETVSFWSATIDTGMPTYSSQRGFRSFSLFVAHTSIVCGEQIEASASPLVVTGESINNGLGSGLGLIPE